MMNEGDTPIETIGDAYNGLRKTAADEKWLIVLTDGAVLYENDEELKGSRTKERLEEVLAEYNQDVNVLYLGIDPVAVIPEVDADSAYQYYTDKAADSAYTLTKLTEMCNMIFGRDVLKNAGKQLTFDVSMKKLILFVQGRDISGVTLKNSSGASVGSPSQEYSPRYGTSACRALDVRGMLECVDPTVSKPVLSALNLLGVEDTSETLTDLIGVLGFFGDTDQVTQEFIQSIRITPNDYAFNADKDEVPWSRH
ncbi:MAG: hypothetical protein ACI3XJ_03495 [Oscillospiraceae bacterium]